MGQVHALADFRAARTARRGFQEWRRTLHGEVLLNACTACTDLPDSALLLLAEDQSEGRLLLRDLIMRVKGWGSGYQFEGLPVALLMHALDIHHALLDALRFELMRRLGWLVPVPVLRQSLIDLVIESERLCPRGLLAAPPMTPEHPHYQEDLRGRGIDRPALARKAIPEALKAFRTQCEGAAADADSDC
ncbi:MAG: hypothetical protein AUK55_11140 [Syntrophobacteraceae bacterium CG2_30_61_12]|nr:MAG: hypothetical protein AUK55_11140 [Syntrophobacteraceae bacterium CG2_30_61_12]PIU31941.1 MAG: hypothetical protein COT06_05395 [Syntrophobacteraceae bacterium CG07_land_8_20_14_0_80_61_8]